MDKHADFVARIGRQMTRWDREFDALAARGNQATGEAKAAFLSHMMSMRASREAAQKTFQEIRFADEASGERMRAGMQEAWVKMQEALEKATADLKA